MENSGDQQRASILHAMAQLPKRLCLAEKVAKVEKQKPKRVDVANVEILEEVWMNAYKGSWDIRRDKPSNEDNCMNLHEYNITWALCCLLFRSASCSLIFLSEQSRFIFFRTLPEVFSKSPGRDVRWIFTMTWDAWNFWETGKIRSPVTVS